MELEEWLDQFAEVSREAGAALAANWTEGEPLPSPRSLVIAMATAYDAAVDMKRLIDAF